MERNVIGIDDSPGAVSALRYPSELTWDVLTAEGGVAHVRPIRPDDAARLVQFHERLSPETVYRRFFSAHPHLREREVERFTRVDYQTRLALVVERDDELVAVARYDRLPDTCDAEVAFVVSDAEQGRGLGTMLLEHLAVAAAHRGIKRFVAETLATNSAMQAVFRNAGFPVEQHFEDGVVKVMFPIEPTVEFTKKVEARAHTATIDGGGRRAAWSGFSEAHRSFHRGATA
jgi:RimJ/RimL family protein N-acetyltransferase